MNTQQPIASGFTAPPAPDPDEQASTGRACRPAPAATFNAPDWPEDPGPDEDDER